MQKKKQKKNPNKQSNQIQMHIKKRKLIVWLNSSHVAYTPQSSTIQYNSCHTFFLWLRLDVLFFFLNSQSSPEKKTTWDDSESILSLIRVSSHAVTSCGCSHFDGSKKQRWREQRTEKWGRAKVRRGRMLGMKVASNLQDCRPRD